MTTHNTNLAAPTTTTGLAPHTENGTRNAAGNAASNVMDNLGSEHAQPAVPMPARTREPFTDKRVRKAFSLAVDREVITGVETAFQMVLIATALVAGLLVANVATPNRKSL